MRIVERILLLRALATAFDEINEDDDDGILHSYFHRYYHFFYYHLSLLILVLASAHSYILFGDYWLEVWEPTKL